MGPSIDGLLIAGISRGYQISLEGCLESGEVRHIGDRVEICSAEPKYDLDVSLYEGYLLPVLQA